MKIFDYPDLINPSTVQITEETLREIEEHVTQLRKKHDIRFKVPHVMPNGETEEIEIRLIPIYDTGR